MFEEFPTAHREFQPHVEFKLRGQFFIYIVVSGILLGILGYGIVKTGTYYVVPTLGLLVGVAIGIYTSRAFKISWDRGAKRVIYEFDIYGALVLIALAILERDRDEFVGFIIHGGALPSTSFALITGIMIGRVLGIRKKIHQVLDENPKRRFPKFRRKK